MTYEEQIMPDDEKPDLIMKNLLKIRRRER